MRQLAIVNATVVTPQGSSALRGEALGRLNIMAGAHVVVSDGVISYVGPAAEAPALEAGAETIDAAGKVLLPGFVDSHTHLVFGGFRPEEFEWRMNGESYMSIMQRGGGIQSTVNATRTTDAKTLEESAQWFINRMSAMGVTTVEAKSGYGLNVETEEKQLDVINALAEKPDQKLDIVATFLGAHAVPAEYKGRTGEYIDLIINEMLPRFKDKARNCDIFCEKNVFEIEDSRRLMKAAREAGYDIKLHADEIVTLGGAELAAELGALSADHLLHVSDRGVADMAEAGVVATLLPLTAFTLREPYAPARKFIDAGGAVALATDLNPGSCLSGSIPLTIALARIYMNMSIEEIISALTINGAAAVGMADKIGSIEVGKRGDFALLHFDNYRMLPYYVGMNCVERTIYNGRTVAVNN